MAVQVAKLDRWQITAYHSELWLCAESLRSAVDLVSGDFKVGELEARLAIVQWQEPSIIFALIFWDRTEVAAADES